MKTIIKVCAFLSVLSALTLGTGCNTVHGFGEDVSSTGHGIQRAAD
jgi:predicted small secreted protein